MRVRGWVVLMGCLCAPHFVRAQKLDQLVSPGELSRAHASQTGIAGCASCHGSGPNVIESKCLQCHKALAARIAEKKGYHADKGTSCMRCHTEHLGRDFDTRGLQQASFRHEETGYKLEGLHAGVKACSSCHKQRSYLGTSTACASCHTDKHSGRLPQCERCHSVAVKMKQVVFDHATTRYALEGAHARVVCASCHKNELYKGLRSETCTACHADPHKAAMGSDCRRCHTMDGWKKTAVSHKEFPLLGKHASVSCAKCHPAAKWKLTAFARCSDCHRDKHLGQFKQACESCHSVSGFKPAKYDHSAFKLDGRHSATECSKCHKSETGVFPGGSGTTVRYRPMRVECVACHRDVHTKQLGSRCEACHSTSSFKVGSFDHSHTRYPLDQKHSKVPCGECHKTDQRTKAVIYKPLGTGCGSCHKDVHLGQIGKDCDRCHSPTGLVFDHNGGAYKLTGKHATVPCVKCHRQEKGRFPDGADETIRYRPIAQECASCHPDFHHGQFKQDCAACHGMSGFKPSSFQHSQSPFQLDGSHRALVCEKCHKVEKFPATPQPVDLVRYRPLAKECQGCHKDPHSGALGRDCRACHSARGWMAVDAAFHKTTAFPLTGRHLTVPCASCHLRPGSTPVACESCHWGRRKDDPYETRLGLACGQCHSTMSWSPADFDHGSATGFALVGEHGGLRCASCHPGRLESAPATCAGCHIKDYDASLNPPHKKLGFVTDCGTCHHLGDGGWSAGRYAHRHYQPEGRHQTAACGDCHRNGNWGAVSRDCVRCHRVEYDAATNPDHKKAGFPTDCMVCHKAGDGSWKQGRFDHSRTEFPLLGAHAGMQCSNCHKGGTFAGLSPDCYSCHRADYESTSSPDHHKAGFSIGCIVCHKATDVKWQQGRFDHGNTQFPLQGAHAKLTCDRCHKGGVYTGLSPDCYSCHNPDYDTTTNPNHKTSGFPTDCVVCHKATDTTWQQGRFDHWATGFPLQGAHTKLTCERCHKGGVYSGLSSDCYSCHRPDYDTTTNPNHKTSGFPTDCAVCHKATDTTWQQGRFDHSATGFPLQGAHTKLTCERCHKGGVYSGLSSDCYSCHKPDYDTTTNPNHKSSGFPTDCVVCHKSTDTTWQQGRFDHSATGFPLQGAHTKLTCERCHKGGVYSGLSSDCYSCHRPDYDSTKNPNHKSSGFPTDCVVCHKSTDTTWQQGRFDHSATGFPLQGAHTKLTCERCHKGGVYSGLSSDCYSCHKPAYDATTNPNHRSSGFPTGCIACHYATDTTWLQGRFSHKFPLKGGHSVPCASCHTTPSNYHVFDCLSCHPLSSIQGEHREVGGFQYTSTACYACHPNGNAGD